MFPHCKGVTIFPSGEILLEITKERIIKAYHTTLGFDELLLMIVKLKGGEIIHIRCFEENTTHMIETWFTRLRNMNPKDKIRLRF